MNLDGIKWEAGTWRAIIMTSQHWYPIAGMKMLNKAKVQGMSVTNIHLDGHTRCDEIIWYKVYPLG